MNVNVGLPNFIPNHLYPQTESARADNRKADYIPQPKASSSYPEGEEIGSRQQRENPKPATQNPESQGREVRAGSQPQAGLEQVDPDGRQGGQQGQGQPQRDQSRQQFTPEQQREIEQLKDRDQEVHNHEQAHQRLGGQYAGAPSYEYTTGPDAQRYAQGGEVSIDTTEIPHDPSATIRKMQAVQAAALAPTDPSAQDYAVARAAARKEMKASQQLYQRTISGRGGPLDNIMTQRNRVIAQHYQSAVTPLHTGGLNLSV
ncbi:putative metalloprotease CJM1_0395 family protein [Aeromonas schubertii]|uniref:putative metalloprotease CJM1_0395 family protein n=1 Tax=Aeromonas TaxID=642 RepID=UPI00067F4DAF|nr:putative metalloprotease CJM1_0395 family protein [Aeromonas schubertii]KUE81178.1 hypothetical protein ATO46_12910 [Aeromonas schubertii]